MTNKFATKPPQTKSDKLIVRFAEPSEHRLCSQLNGHYQTHYVWQMQYQEAPQRIETLFNRIRLPRIMSVNYPYTVDILRQAYEQAPYLWVISYQNAIWGCLAGFIEPGRQVFQVNSLIVDERVRRQGLGQLLLSEAKKVALRQQCLQIVMTVQTKNDPAIQFIQKAGFAFAGYNDQYFYNGDIALIFSLQL